MSQITGKTKRALVAKQDLAIQDTLQMSEEERLDLLVDLMIDKIIADSTADGELLRNITSDQP